MISEDLEQDWPEYVWAVDDGVVYEARLSNSVLGEYHGYPMKTDDFFTRFVRGEWERR